ncbi:MAG: AarF/UbiB family protein, partial [Pseudomonadota bacterium]
AGSTSGVVTIQAAAAASLGQVHRATTLGGVDVACKLQYPDMQSAIAADLSQLRLMFSVYETYDKAIKTTHIFDELKDRLQEELDYIREGKQMQLYAFMLKDENKSVHVPLYVPELSTPRLLTATWLDGQKILNFKSASLDVRNQLALNMFRAWYVPLYHYGVIHGDPHLGNYSVRDDLSINLLDFGCVRAFRSAFVEGVINLYRSLLTNDIALSVHAFETWGFTDLNKDQIETLLIWARFLYEPLLDDNKRVIGQTESGVYGRETAKKVHARLREVGRVTVPREFVFMDRAALGLGSVFIHLQAQINWHQLFEEMIANFDVKELQTRQNKALKQFDLL